MTETRRTPSGGYGQDWPAYNAAQINEKGHFLSLLHELCAGIEEPPPGAGRPRLPLRDMAFCAVLKVYSTFSSRRSTSELKEAHAKELVSKVPHFNSISNYMEAEHLTEYLKRLIEESSLPLRSVETVFAVDATGLGTCRHRLYYNRHRGRREKKREWVKLHAICGVQTNVITCAEVSEGRVNESAFFKALVENTARSFDLSEVSADAGYIDAANHRHALLMGATPYIAFRKNCTPYGEFKSTLWKQMLHQYQTRNPEFMEHYYKRNNVESTFSMLKAKFGGRLRSKSARAQTNEALCKVICHNLCVLIQSIYELGIAPSFWANPLPARGAVTAAALGGSISERIVAAARPTPLADHRVGEACPRGRRPPSNDQFSLPGLFDSADKEAIIHPPLPRQPAHNGDVSVQSATTQDKGEESLPLFRLVA